MSVFVSKKTVRADVLARRASLQPQVIAAAGAAVQATLARAVAAVASDAASRPVAATAPLVSAYVPVGTEPGGKDLPGALADADARVLLPVFEPGAELDWALYEPGRLVHTARGLVEPTGRRLGPAAVTECDLLIVPAIGVDHRGTRLGRGAGCYDRALARVPSGVPVVALLHDGELVDALPADPHDRPVTAVITPAIGWWEVPDRPGA
jgi:5-formyltetrahydrofolate cyclo-ligase